MRVAMYHIMLSSHGTGLTKNRTSHTCIKGKRFHIWWPDRDISSESSHVPAISLYLRPKMHTSNTSHDGTLDILMMS